MTADPALGGLRPSQVGAATAAFTYAGALYGGGTTGLVSDMTVTSAQTGTGVFAPLHWRYTYNSLGNITLLQELNSSDVVTGSTAYTYDDQSQLTRASRNNNSQIWNYHYDNYGNLRSRDYRVGYIVQDQIAYTYGDADWLDLLTAVSGKKNGVNFSGSYTYDGAGNPTSYYNVGDLSSWTMTWKNGRQLATASNGTHTVSYDYDLDGLRTCKIVDGVRHDYFYAGGQLLRETYTQSGTNYDLDFLYDQNGRPFLLYLTQTTGGITTSAPYYYILNLQGDVMYLVDASGVPAASYSYDPYGNALSATGSLANINPLRYRGYYFDPESGLYYLQSRYYDPMLGRFINGDGYASTGQGFLGFNMFAYCNNSPIKYKDNCGSNIVLADDATEKEKREYERAVAYLKKSQSARDIIEQLENSDVVFTIQFVYDDNMGYDNKTKTIQFDPYSALLIHSGFQSPALGLLHEMGHAVQDLDDPLLDMDDPAWTEMYWLEKENDNVEHNESPAAQELGEHVRYYYADSYLCKRVYFSTQRGPIKMTVRNHFTDLLK